MQKGGRQVDRYTGRKPTDEKEGRKRQTEIPAGKKGRWTDKMQHMGYQSEHRNR
jgi:hypothetical protein